MLSHHIARIRREGVPTHPSLRAGAWAVLLLVALLGATGAGAVTIADDPCLDSQADACFTIQEIIGGDSEVMIELSDAGDDILLTATVTEGRGDLRGLYFDLADGIESIRVESQTDGLDLSEIVELGSFIDVGPGGNLRGGPDPVAFGFGVEIGTPGPARDSYSTVTLLISGVDGEPLDLTSFSEQSFGARLTSPGRKLRGQAPVIVPEPGTAALTALGLGMLAFAGRRRT